MAKAEAPTAAQLTYKYLGQDLTYAECKEWANVKGARYSIEEGRVLREMRYTRLRRNANGTYTVFLTRPARRREAWRTQVGDPEAIDLFTIFPDDRIRYEGPTADPKRGGHVYWPYWANEVGRERVRRLIGRRLSTRYWYEPAALRPTTPPAPKPKPMRNVPEPRYKAKDSTYRVEYEVLVAKWGNGSLEDWYEAYIADQKTGRANDQAHAEWLENTRPIKLWNGAIVDTEGRLSQRSYDRHLAQERAHKRKIEAIRKKEQKAEERRLREREKVERMNAKAALAWVARFTKAKVKAKTAKWLKARGIKPNADGTIPVVKIVFRDGYEAHHNKLYGHMRANYVSYEPGTRPEAPDYTPIPTCGGGLHFGASFEEAKRYLLPGANYNNTDHVALLCHADLATTVIVDGVKVKAKWCDVICELPAEAHGDLIVGKESQGESPAARIAAKMAGAARKAVEAKEEKS